MVKKIMAKKMGKKEEKIRKAVLGAGEIGKDVGNLAIESAVCQSNVPHLASVTRGVLIRTKNDKELTSVPGITEFVDKSIADVDKIERDFNRRCK